MTDGFGLTFYGPDALRSRLVETLDQEIVWTLGLEPVDRFFSQLGADQVEEIYASDRERIGADWDLLVRLFSFGPVAVSVWHGRDASDRLREMKSGRAQIGRGSSQRRPAMRKRFLVDTRIVNLLHSSDSSSAALREYGILRSSVVSSRLGFPSPDFGTIFWARHSALVTAARLLLPTDLVDESLSSRLAAPNTPVTASVPRLVEFLQTSLPLLPCSQKAPLRAILERQEDALTLFLRASDCSAWDHFVLECGVRGGVW